MEKANDLHQHIQHHYAPENLGDAVLSALAEAGKDLNHLKLEDLAPIDEFHIRGREASIELAQQLNLDATTHVLDVGCGLGGASRYLAQEYGCHVTGLDLIEEYCRVAEMLANRVGLASRVTYRHGNALEMPFEDVSFDVVWTQHSAMNVPDKARLYGEIWRVLRPGGLFASYDVLAGPGGSPHYPVPWAGDPSFSFLVTPHELRELLEKTGFSIASWRDTSEAGLAWFREVAAKVQRQGAGPVLGFQVMMGPDFPMMAQNQVRNLTERRIVLVEAVAHRPLE